MNSASTLDEAIDRRIEEKRTHVQALSTAIMIADTVKRLGAAVRAEDYTALRRELSRLMGLCSYLMTIVAGCESSFAPNAITRLRKEATLNE